MFARALNKEYHKRNPNMPTERDYIISRRSAIALVSHANKVVGYLRVTPEEALMVLAELCYDVQGLTKWTTITNANGIKKAIHHIIEKAASLNAHNIVAAMGELAAAAQANISNNKQTKVDYQSGSALMRERDEYNGTLARLE